MASKSRLVDRFFLYGLPIVAVVVIWFGVRSLLPPDNRDPIQLLHDGAVSIGDDTNHVLAVLRRPPSDVEAHEDGRVTLTYRHTIYNGDLAMEDAKVQISAAGKVESINYDTSKPPVAQ